MAKRKSRAEAEPRQLTRKEHRQRAADRERNRKLMLGTGIALGLALLLVVIGLISEFAIRPNSTVATVGETRLVTRDFWKRTLLQQNQLQNQLVRLTQLEQQFGGQGFFTTQINQIQATLLSPFTLGVEVLDQMVREEVIRQQAAARGITVSAEELDETLREEVASQVGAVTVPQATATAESAAAATATAAEWTPTPTATVDASGAVTATATPIPTPEPPTPLPVMNDDQYSTGLAELETNLRTIAGMSLEDYRHVVEARLLNDKLLEVVATDLVTPTTEQVHARHILLQIREPVTTTAVAETAGITLTGGLTDTTTLTATDALTDTAANTVTVDLGRDEAATLALAQELRARILAGEDFATLAQEYSDDPGSGANGGDLGWFGRGMMVAPFEEAAFSLPVGEISEPIQSDFGYHIIEVLERDNARPKDEATLEQEKAVAYDDWLRVQISETPVERPSNLMSMLPRGLEAINLQAAPAPAQ